MTTEGSALKEHVLYQGLKDSVYTEKHGEERIYEMGYRFKN